MAKIIQIMGNTVSIGLDDGSIKEVDISCCSNFEPKVGDEVDYFVSGDKAIVMKKEGLVQAALSGSSKASAPHKVNKVGYVLLAFFLGGIGIHKFYAGHIFLGILYLLFCWTFIPGLVALIEMIIAICKEADQYGNIDA